MAFWKLLMTFYKLYIYNSERGESAVARKPIGMLRYNQGKNDLAYFRKNYNNQYLLSDRDYLWLYKNRLS